MFIVANESMTPWVKITEKVSFHIASEASYVYILSGHGQKVTKNAKNGPFWRLFENLKLSAERCYQTEIGGKCQNGKIQMRHF